MRTSSRISRGMGSIMTGIGAQSNLIRKSMSMRTVLHFVLAGHYLDLKRGDARHTARPQTPRVDAGRWPEGVREDLQAPPYVPKWIAGLHDSVDVPTASWGSCVMAHSI